VKIIFLDFDGVLNDRTSVPFVKKSLVKRLNGLVQKTKSTVVVSSTWRKHGDSFMFWQLFHALGFMIDVDGTTGNENVVRGLQIKFWLERNFTWKDGFPVRKRFMPSSGKTEERLESFIILDDDSDMDLFMPRLIKTSSLCGLQDEDVDKSTYMLSEKVNWDSFNMNWGKGLV